MKLIALQNITGKTKTIEKGTIFEIPDSKAIELISAGVAASLIRQIAYKVYSDVLGGYLWITDDDTFDGGRDAVYTSKELFHLLGVKPEQLKIIHQAKIDFKAKIEGGYSRNRE